MNRRMFLGGTLASGALLLLRKNGVRRTMTTSGTYEVIEHRHPVNLQTVGQLATDMTYNVENFGARRDGRDCTQAFNAAIEACRRSRAGRLS